jgi:poly(A) polymerase Pap1
MENNARNMGNQPRPLIDKRRIKQHKLGGDRGAFKEVHQVKETRALKALLEQRRCLPVKGDDDDLRRQNALHVLETILTQWASSILTTSDDSKWQRPRVSLVTFGSYRLGVHRPESDLDVLAVTPPTCSREHFFASLVEVLRSDTRISNVHAIASAYTVSLSRHGGSIDPVQCGTVHPGINSHHLDSDPARI